jgi:hypothetical protein
MRSIPFILLAIFLTGCFARQMTDAEKIAEADKLKAEVAAKVDQDYADSARTDADRARDAQIAQAASNLAPIAQVVTQKGQPALGKAITQQKTTIDGALGLPVALYPFPVVSAEKLLNDAKGALEDYKVKSDDLQKKLDDKARAAELAEARAAEAQRKVEIAEAVAKAEKEKADSEARTAWWLKVGTGALGGLATLTALAARLGLPGGGIANAVVGLVSPMIQKRTNVAESAVAAADVARQGLGLVETIIAQKHPELSEKLSGAISQITGGKAAGIEQLFKTVAKGYSTDNHGDQLEAIDSLLTALRGKSITTQGGVPVALQHTIQG